MLKCKPSLLRNIGNIFLFFALSLGGVRAQEYAGDAYTIRLEAKDATTTRHVSLGVGKSLMIDLPVEAGEVFVGNPQVANAVVRSAKRLYVIAGGNGQTALFVMDKAGNRMGTLAIMVGRDISELKRILKVALPTNDIRVETVDDTIILSGSVASAAEAQKANDIASAFVGYTAVGGGTSSATTGTSINVGGFAQIVQGKLINSITIRSQEQVMLRVTVAEVQRNVLKQLGISPSGSLSGQVFEFFNQPSMSQQPGSYFTSVGGITRLGGNGGISLGWGGKSSSLASVIQTLESNGVARVLAEPTVSAISGESAKFMAGGQIPYTTSSSIDPKTGVCTITTELKDYGVTLNFTPTVLSEGRISLHLSTEVTDVDTSSNIHFSCSNTVGFKTRRNETTVELPSGGSIVSAGLIQQTSRQVLEGVPGLSNLPVLGALFRSRDYQRQESELLIIVTPYIARTLRPDEVRRPDDGFADASDGQSMLLGRLNRLYSHTDNPEAIRNVRGNIGFIHD